MGEVRARPGGSGERTAPSSSCQKSLSSGPHWPPVLAGIEASLAVQVRQGRRQPTQALVGRRATGFREAGGRQ